MLSVAGRAAGSLKPSSTKCRFTDVKSGTYYNAVMWAVEQGITSGTSSTKFSPDDVCSRAQIVTFLYRAENGWFSNNIGVHPTYYKTKKLREFLLLWESVTLSNAK